MTLGKLLYPSMTQFWQFLIDRQLLVGRHIMIRDTSKTVVPKSQSPLESSAEHVKRWGERPSFDILIL